MKALLIVVLLALVTQKDNQPEANSCDIEISKIESSECQDRGDNDIYEIAFSVRSENTLPDSIVISGPLDTVLLCPSNDCFFNKIEIPANNQFQELKLEFRGSGISNDCDKVILLFPVASCN